MYLDFFAQSKPDWSGADFLCNSEGAIVFWFDIRIKGLFDFYAQTRLANSKVTDELERSVIVLYLEL